MFRNRYLKICIVIEFCLLIISALMLFIPGKTYRFSGEYGEINGNYIEVSGTELKSGRYIVNIGYQIDEDAEIYIAKDENAGGRGEVLSDPRVLSSQLTNLEFEVWIRGGRTGTNLVIESEDEFSVNIDAINIQETNFSAVCTFLFFLALLTATLIISVSVKNIAAAFKAGGERANDMKEKLMAFGVLGITFFVSNIPLFTHGIVLGDDSLIQLLRLEGLKDGLLSGQFPVRVEPTFMGGYGYAFSTYYGSLFYNIPAFIRLIGFDLVTSYKAYIVFVNLFTVIFSYICFKGIFNDRRVAVLGSILYCLSIYRIQDLYQRGAVGEVSALVFLPLVVLGLYRVLMEKEGKIPGWLIAVFGFSGVIESHVLSTEIYGMFTILICLICFKKTFNKKVFLNLLKVVVVTIVLNLTFLYPFLENFSGEEIYVKKSVEYEGGMYGVPFLKYIDFFNGEISYNGRYVVEGAFGVSIIIVICTLVYAIIKGYMKNSKYRKEAVILGIVGVFGFFIASSLFPWDGFITFLRTFRYGKPGDGVFQAVGDLFNNVQYPMRYLTVSILLVVIALCVPMIEIKAKEKKLFGIVFWVVTAFTIFQAAYVGIRIADTYPQGEYRSIKESDKELTWNIGNCEYLPLREDGDMPYYVMFNDIKDAYWCTNAEITYFNKEYNNIDLHVKASQDDTGMIELPLLYYRGYSIADASSGEKMITFKAGSSARLAFIVEGGYEGDVSVRYTGETMWHIADAVSLITLIVIILRYICCIHICPFWTFFQRNRR